jgi:hypothetical protein
MAGGDEMNCTLDDNIREAARNLIEAFLQPGPIERLAPLLSKLSKALDTYDLACNVTDADIPPEDEE